MQVLLSNIRSCTICEKNLPLGPNPIISASRSSRIIIIGQAPGKKVHETSVPWNDPSGKLLRQWMGLSDDDFYNSRKVALIPMGFCYPGKGKSGDMPPRPECAPEWHGKILSELEEKKLTLLIGQYSQGYYLKERRKETLTETVRSYQEYLPQYFPLPHPSPRNRIWMSKNPWFDKEVIPVLRQLVKKIL